jgi:hypothetical protein
MFQKSLSPERMMQRNATQHQLKGKEERQMIDALFARPRNHFVKEESQI